MNRDLLQLFVESFDTTPTLEGAAPGRVNLIGEHLDYNGGSVLPATLAMTLRVAMRPRDDSTVRVATNGFPDTPPRDLSDVMRGDWSDHALAAVQMGNEVGLLKGGADIAIHSDIPSGAGLSSSAALLVALLKTMRSYDEHCLLGDIDIAMLAQRVEREYIGVPCGIMDQFAVAVGEPGHAILLDTTRLTHKLIALPTSHTFAIIHSGITRELSDGRYARRAEECRRAEQAFNTRALCTLDLATIKDKPRVDLALRRRARHCVTEQQRVMAAAADMRQGNIEALGELMIESHRSMCKDFEMSLPAIDYLVADAVEQGAVGSRLTGGGFGGCIVSLVEKGQLEVWSQRLLARHPEAHFVATTG
ncbi:MAG: galactokinase [Pseudomonadota bacterium]